MPATATQLRLNRRRAQKGAGTGWPAFNPRPGLWIGDVDYSAYVVHGSPRLKATVSPYAGTFSVLLDGASAVLAAINAEQDLTFNRAGVTYIGRIRNLIPSDQDIAGTISLAIECQDLTTLLDDDICALAASPPPQVDAYRATVESDAQRIQWLLNSFGHHAVTMRHAQTLYASVPATDYTGKTLREAIKDVLSYSGGFFYVDSSRDLHTFIDEFQYAPFGLSETPDESTSFAYGSLQYPSDSIDLRNAVFVAGGVPALPISVTEAITTAGAVSEREWGVVTLKRDGTARILEVARGPVTPSPSSTTCTPTFAQPTASGNCLIAVISGSSPNAPATTTPGWINIQNGAGGPGPTWVSIFCKPNCGASEAAPTFTVAGGTATFFVQLLELSGVSRITDPSVHSGGGAGGAATTITHTNFALDPENGDLFIFVSSWTLSSATASFADAFNNNMIAVQTGNTGDVSRPRHACFSYAIGPRGRWYTNEASIAANGRREATVAVSDTMSPADVDAVAAAYLALNAGLRREGSFACRQPGLAPGQRFTISSSLYSIPTIVDPLGNYSAIVQNVTTSFPDEEPAAPRFEVEFGAPTLTLAVQLSKAIKG